jgi:hypothetical protein
MAGEIMVNRIALEKKERLRKKERASHRAGKVT